MDVLANGRSYVFQQDRCTNDCVLAALGTSDARADVESSPLGESALAVHAHFGANATTDLPVSRLDSGHGPASPRARPLGPHERVALAIFY